MPNSYTPIIDECYDGMNAASCACSHTVNIALHQLGRKVAINYGHCIDGQQWSKYWNLFYCFLAEVDQETADAIIAEASIQPTMEN